MKKHYKTVEDLEGDLRLDFDEFRSYKEFVYQEKIMISALNLAMLTVVNIILL